jgi:hypothetical protein
MDKREIVEEALDELISVQFCDNTHDEATTARDEVGQIILTLAERLAADRDAWKKALQSLTPSGSEFTEPHECERFVRTHDAEQWEAIKRMKRQRDELEAELARKDAIEQAARELLNDIKDNWYIEKLKPGDVAESDVSVDHILALAVALERKP